jgi:hypothetical protein
MLGRIHAVSIFHRTIRNVIMVMMVLVIAVIANITITDRSSNWAPYVS